MRTRDQGSVRRRSCRGGGLLFLSVLAGVAPVAAAGAATPSPDPPPLAVAPDLPGQADPRTVQAPAVQAAPATVEPTQVTPRPAVAVVTPRVAMTPPNVAPSRSNGRSEGGHAAGEANASTAGGAACDAERRCGAGSAAARDRHATGRCYRGSPPPPSFEWKPLDRRLLALGGSRSRSCARRRRRARRGPTGAEGARGMRTSIALLLGLGLVLLVPSAAEKSVLRPAAGSELFAPVGARVGSRRTSASAGHRAGRTHVAKC